MKCSYCELVELKKNLIYDDEEVVVAVKEHAAISGQIIVFPKQHLTIFEMVSNKLLEKMAAVANKAGIAVFETLGVQGTNLLIKNGLGAGQNVPHVAFEIIPRKKDDLLDLQWDAQQATEEDTGTILALLKEEEKNIKELSKVEKAEAHKPDEARDNYMIKTLRKIP